MKLIINYDLLEKVNNANGILKPQKIILKEMKTQAIYYGIFTGMDLLSGRDDGIRWGSNLMICSFFFAAKVASTVAFERKNKNTIEFLANLDLTTLSLQLGNLNVNTSLGLLKESKLIKTEYKLTHENLKPIIMQNKYISVPTHNGLGDIKDTSILQEHEMGSKQYVLSIGSPSKSFKMAHAYS